MKKCTKIIIFSSLFVLGLSTFSLMVNSNILNNVHAEHIQHVGYHYAAKTPTETESGWQEFWTCCDCHEAFLTKPDGTFTNQDASNMVGGQPGPGHVAYLPKTGSGLPTSLRILYQGDSITDSKRDRNTLDLGNGYARMVSEKLEELYGEDIDFTFMNRGNSGWNLIDNWNAGGVNHYEEQFYQYDADIATILIGYNDIQDAFGSGKTESPVYVSDEAYEAAYDELLAGLKEHGTYAICIGPYFIYDRADTEYSQPEFANKRAIVQALAEKYDFTYLDMKPAMDAAKLAGAEEMELFGDLTHPSHAGNAIIADLLVNELRDYFDPSYVRNPNAGTYVPITGHNDNSNDLTNVKAYCYTYLGYVSYDDTVYYNRDDFASSESVKLTNVSNYNCAETSVAFIYGSTDLTDYNIEFDVKTENALPSGSIMAHSSVWTMTRNFSSSKAFDLTSVSNVTNLENGWKHVSINVNDWMEEDASNATVLKSMRQLVISMSRGSSASARSNYGIDESKPSIMWIDNLRLVSENPEQPRLAELTTGQAIIAGPTSFPEISTEEITGKALYFKYKLTGGSTTSDYGQLTFMYYPEDHTWNNCSGNIRLFGDGTAKIVFGLNLETKALDDGWYEIIVPSSCFIQDAIHPTKLNMIYSNTYTGDVSKITLDLNSIKVVEDNREITTTSQRLFMFVNQLDNWKTSGRKIEIDLEPTTTVDRGGTKIVCSLTHKDGTTTTKVATFTLRVVTHKIQQGDSGAEIPNSVFQKSGNIYTFKIDLSQINCLDGMDGSETIDFISIDQLWRSFKIHAIRYI